MRLILLLCEALGFGVGFCEQHGVIGDLALELGVMVADVPMKPKFDAKGAKEAIVDYTHFTLGEEVRVLVGKLVEQECDSC
jgi:hypothetical protein